MTFMVAFGRFVHLTSLNIISHGLTIGYDMKSTRYYIGVDPTVHVASGCTPSCETNCQLACHRRYHETSDSWGSLNSLKLLIVACFWLWHMIVLYICLKLQSSGNQRIFWRWGFDMKQLPPYPQTSQSLDHFTVETTMHGDLGPPFGKKKKKQFFGSCSAATGDSWAQKLHHTLQDVLLQREEH